MYDVTKIACHQAICLNDVLNKNLSDKIDKNFNQQLASKSNNVVSLKESGSETVHRNDIPDAMNSYFCSVGKDLADKISPVPNPLLSGDFEMNKTKAKFHFRTIEVQNPCNHYFVNIVLGFYIMVFIL